LCARENLCSKIKKKKSQTVVSPGTKGKEKKPVKAEKRTEVQGTPPEVDGFAFGKEMVE